MSMALSDALVAVDANANSEWRTKADEVIFELAKERLTFTSDDIWDRLFAAGVSTPEHRAMGPRIIAAVKNKTIKLLECGFCNTTKVMVATQREEAHKMDIPVYLSLVFGR